MRDLISRQAAIDAICEHGTDLERRGIMVLAVADHKQVTVDLLEKLPSAERKGKWIDGFCSECHEEAITEWNDRGGEYALTRYCPYCGSEMSMRGEEDEVD